MDYKMLSIALVIVLLIVVAAFVFVTYGDDIAAMFSSGRTNVDMGGVFGNPPEDVNPPAIPAS